MSKDDFRLQKDEIFDIFKNWDFGPKSFWNDDFAPSNSKIFSADAEAPLVLCTAQLTIFENVENLIFLMSDIIVGQQILIPEQSEMVRELEKFTPDAFFFSLHADPTAG